MIFETVSNEIQTEMGGFRSFSRFFDALEIGGATNSFMRPETELAPQRFLIRRFEEPHLVSNRQPFSALCAPPLQYAAASLGRHSLKEAVSAFSFQIAWLKCLLRH